jgi:N-acetylneuraminic acid mutarotase
VRHSHTAVILNDGGKEKTFIYGGRNEVLNLRDLYSIDGSTATARANGRYRKDHCAVAINQGAQMWVFGGTGDAVEGDTPLNRLDVYTPSSNSWSMLASGGANAASARAAHSCVVYQNKVFVFGGIDGSSRRLNELWAYTLGANSWENLSNSKRQNFHQIDPIFNSIKYFY